MFRSLIFSLVVAFSLLGLALPGIALSQDQQPAQQTVTLQVENMTCSMCPYTVKKALKKIDGVKDVEAKYEGRGEGWAKITFNSSKTDVESLIRATTDAGYPSHL